MFHDYHFQTMRSTDSKGFSSLWLPLLLVLCMIATMYGAEHLKGALLIYKTSILSGRWFENEVRDATMKQPEQCSTSTNGLKICRFQPMKTLFSDNPKNIWIDWDALRSKENFCNEPCTIPEELTPLAVYHIPVELNNASCTLPQCTIASSENITISETVTSAGNISIVARGDITIGSMIIGENAGALIISTQGTVQILKSDIQSRATILQAIPADPVTPAQLARNFTSRLTIIEGVRAVEAENQGEIKPSE